MVKRIYTIIAILISVAGIAMAEDSLRLAFLTTDNSVTEIDASSLSMSVNGEKLSVCNNTEKLEFELPELIKMYFTSDQSGVESISDDSSAAYVSAYSIEGIFAGKYASMSDALSSLPKGIYIIKDSNGKNVKIAVK